MFKTSQSVTHWVWVVILLISVSGCATKNVENDFSFRNAMGHGLLVGSLTTKDPGNWSGSDITMVFTPKDPQASRVRITINSKCDAVQHPRSTDFKDVCGHLFAIELPPGDYALDNWTIEPLGSGVFTPKQWQAPTVTIQRGKATYVGNIYLRFDSEMKGPGNDGYHGWPVDTDMRDRDLPMLLRRYPALKQDDVVVSLMSFGPPNGICVTGSVGVTSFTRCSDD
jgi:hypothetical protein